MLLAPERAIRWALAPGAVSMVSTRSVRKVPRACNSPPSSGTNNMLDFPAYSDIDRARQLLAAVEKKDSMYQMLKNAGPFEISFRIGSELGQDIFSDCSLVTATYRIGSIPVGTMGVIGPTRMPYGKVVSVLDYMSKSLGSILTNLLEED